MTSAAALERAYRDGRATPSEIASRALRSAADLASSHLFLHLDVAEVHAQADQSTERWRTGRPRSPLDGVPIAIKDQIDIAGVTTTAGTSFLRAPATRDAEVIARLRAAGAVVFGKTNMSELALAPSGLNPHHGAAKNPWSAQFPLDTGGSSSGSAAAVAAGVVPLALGTDLGGSLRIPAALCGVAALKPTWDRVPKGGVLPIAWSLEHVGPIGASVDDLARAFSVLALDPRPIPGRPVGRKVGVCERWWRAAEPETAGAVHAAIARAGGEPVAIDLEHVERALAAFAIVCNVEAAAALGRHADAPLGPSVRVALALGRATPAVTYVEAQRLRAQLARELADALALVDVLVTPTTAFPARPYAADAFAAGELDEQAAFARIAFTFAANLSGLPAVQVPCARSSAGLPIGLQVIAPFGADELALAFAAEIERTSERLRPPFYRELLASQQENLTISGT
jgi:Asp-tRNA(Asn)/Glu-tRNA(Gln) amidotransferase A subunit family amidase